MRTTTKKEIQEMGEPTKAYLIMDNLGEVILSVDSELPVVIDWCENYLDEHPECIGLTLWENKRLFISPRIMRGAFKA